MAATPEPPLESTAYFVQNVDTGSYLAINGGTSGSPIVAWTAALNQANMLVSTFMSRTKGTQLTAGAV